MIDYDFEWHRGFGGKKAEMFREVLCLRADAKSS